MSRRALAAIIEGRVSEAVDRWLAALGVDDEPDRRNGHYRQHLTSELGDIELSAPRMLRYRPTEVVRAYARRGAEIDRISRMATAGRPGPRRRPNVPCPEHAHT